MASANQAFGKTLSRWRRHTIRPPALEQYGVAEAVNELFFMPGLTATLHLRAHHLCKQSRGSFPSNARTSHAVLGIVTCTEYA
jgi:hypothetical protein